MRLGQVLERPEDLRIGYWREQGSPSKLLERPGHLGVGYLSLDPCL